MKNIEERAEFIREQMLIKGITQSQLACLIGTDQKNVSNWVNGNTEPSADNVHRLCNALRITVNEYIDAERYGFWRRFKAHEREEIGWYIVFAVMLFYFDAILILSGEYPADVTIVVTVVFYASITVCAYALLEIVGKLYKIKKEDSLTRRLIKRCKKN